MDANLSISSSTALGGAAGLAATGAAPAGAELRGADFADLLRGLQGEPGRQDLAAAGLAQAGLQAVALGPQLELITAATPVPDADSLMAFARTQGLDDGTLAMLFGVPGSAASSGLTDSAGQGASLLAAAAVPAAWALGSAASPLISGGVAPDAVSVTAATGASMLAAQASALGLSDLSWQVSKTALGAEATAAATSATTATAETGTPDTLAEALRLQLQMPREAITALTRRLAGLSGNGQAVAWGQLQAQALADSPEVLDMREFFSGQGALVEPELALDAAAPTTSSPLLPEGARTAASGLTLQGDNPAQASQAGARLEHYQQLADKLGQALAQRLQAQIERGEWKLQMRMDPASLGRIDLELDMHANGLDAVFRSDNPLTRELIAQGLPRLRDSLQQSGTTVAQVWVNGDSAGQAGGNPTPQSRAPQETARSSGSTSAAEAPALPAASTRRTSDSDWDVLA